jgi:hydroxysqualene dehydroxylase
VAVIGAGWAGIAAAVRAVERGLHVTLFEAAASPGGRARTVALDEGDLDNGQHIMIGAYTATLALMRSVGADPEALLWRMPLAIEYPDGPVLQAPDSRWMPAAWLFARAVASAPRWSWQERRALLMMASRWWLDRFIAPADATVAALTASLPERVRVDLIDPLCVAALNTPSHEASAQVFLRVLRDALFGARGGADLLLPRRPLGDLLPQPAMRWLAAQGAVVHAGRRVTGLLPQGKAWLLRHGADEDTFDAVILATPAAEAARLAAPIAPAWSAVAAAFSYEPIITVYIRAPSAERWLPPMRALRCNEQAPAQFAFDLETLHGRPALFSFVISGARRWVDLGPAATARAVLAQAAVALKLPGVRALDVVHQAAEKRATFRCIPNLQRTPAAISPGLWAAGDHVQGPYPATIEGAVRSGIEAADLAAGQA